MKERNLLIVGAGGHALVVAETAAAEGWRIQGFVDEAFQPGTVRNGVPVLGGDELWRSLDVHDDVEIIVALGEQAVRRNLAMDVLERRGRMATVTHPAATISGSAQIGLGTVVNANVTVNAGAMIGRFSILNSACVIEHECVLEDGVQVGPGTVLCGNVRCGEDAFIGAGATVIPNVRIGARATIGAGASVIRDVPADARIVGVPGRAI